MIRKDFNCGKTNTDCLMKSKNFLVTLYFVSMCVCMKELYGCKYLVFLLSTGDG